MPMSHHGELQTPMKRINSTRTAQGATSLPLDGGLLAHQERTRIMTRNVICPLLRAAAAPDRHRRMLSALLLAYWAGRIGGSPQSAKERADRTCRVDFAMMGGIGTRDGFLRFRVGVSYIKVKGWPETLDRPSLSVSTSTKC
jgi:hypothetical protein